METQISRIDVRLATALTPWEYEESGAIDLGHLSLDDG